MNSLLKEIEEKVLNEIPLGSQEVSSLTSLDGSDLFELFALANRLRERYHGNEIRLCSIINAKSGLCPEDCAFCAQSLHSRTDIDTYPLVEAREIMTAAQEAQGNGAVEFSIVTSGYGIKDEKEMSNICRALRELKEGASLERCASLGVLDRAALRRLKEAGLQRFHHNLETARSFFSKICTTHEYEEDIETVRVAKKVGLKVCCGGIFGLGESWEQRIELALTLRELGVDSVPLNFLNPIKGTKLESANNLTPRECLEIIALYRLLLPEKDVLVCGGREVNLRDLQSLMFFAGANGTMTGNYLTTPGRSPREDRQLIEDLGLRIKKII
ncbi:MAG: biotin synthase BioB [Deltaproteobacteria bacterium]|nr:MAG: biotin synthase BioB [Deltaproteobacteria bacterium]